VNGIDEALCRAELYNTTGVDWIFVQAPESVEELQILWAVGLSMVLAYQ
jgi:2-methylisocitrate lyase-like PEP mutase family enzyme